jgi:hypothetical protein
MSKYIITIQTVFKHIIMRIVKLELIADDQPI